MSIRKRRLRKKLRTDEFARFIFDVSFSIHQPFFISTEQENPIIIDFEDQFLQFLEHHHLFVSGITQPSDSNMEHTHFHFFIQHDIPRKHGHGWQYASVLPEQRHLVQQWLQHQLLVQNLSCSELYDEKYINEKYIDEKWNNRESS